MVKEKIKNQLPSLIIAIGTWAIVVPIYGAYIQHFPLAGQIAIGFGIIILGALFKNG